MQSLVLKLTCDDQPGIVSAVTTFLAARRCNIAESKQYWDRVSNRFFMRVEFDTPEGIILKALEEQFVTTGKEFAMQWSLVDAKAPMKTLILVSKFDHCLNDLLYRNRTKALNMDIVAVASNHTDSQKLVESHDCDFYHLPVTKETKAEQEKQIWELIQSTGAELVILARYMQILSDDLCRKLSGMAINIHHSFLPGFKGARPYARAYERGVKLIGATAHYVTADLDEGPIIEQDVERVDHNDSAADLVMIGADVECHVLARAVKYHSEHRVLINGERTVVFK
ncbi:MAG: formyltetrahydrofolate deformylase [Alphaproteobacteria bacterium]